VSDRLYFSCWVKDNRTQPVLHQFQKLLDRFPFSKLAKRGPVLRVYVLEHAEPALLEREFPVGTEIGPIVDAAREFMQADCSCEIDASWDLWDYDETRGQNDAWKLSPVPVILACYGPEFGNELGDHLRIEFGPDARFLPSSGVEGSLRMGQSNLKSLLHLVSEMERRLSVERRQVWSESGANFAEVLRQAVGNYHVN
jgi:hypothetical protein